MLIVAEISGSHDGSFEKCMQLIKAAADSGANAVKFQTFEPERLSTNVRIKTGPWAGKSTHELYRKAHTPKAWHRELFSYAKELGLTPFSTPFHPRDVEFLETIGCSLYKISSFDIINYELLQVTADTERPIILSTGMATEGEIVSALDVVNGVFLTLLHCVSAYPADSDNFNLATMIDLMKYGTDVGISDHTKTHQVPVIATYMGADVIEKHICLDRGGVDGKFALLPEQFETMVHAIRKAEERIGRPTYGVKPGEEASFELRPSLHFAKDLPVGTVVRRDHLKVCRPNDGLHPRHLNSFIGRRLVRSVREDEPVV